MIAQPLNWVKSVERSVLDLSATPLWGNPPEVPWEALSRALGTLMNIEGIALTAGATRPVRREEILSLCENTAVRITLHLKPLTPALFLLIGKEDLAALTSWCLAASGKGLISPFLQEGFYYYLCSHVAQQLNAAHALSDLTLSIDPAEPAPTEECACIDLSIAHPKQRCTIHLLCPLSFHAAFVAYFSTPQDILASAKGKNVLIPLSLVLGEVALSTKEWQKVRVGDCILLDRCHIDPSTRKGTATLAAGDTPLFYVRLKEGHIKIIDYASYYEDKPAMDASASQEQPPTEKSLEEEASHLWSADEQEMPPAAGEKPPFPAKEISLSLTVELARVQMPLEKVLALQPGNTVELPLATPHLVHVLIGGALVAEAELIKLGDKYAIRLTKLGR
jgi:type III secretion system YscQ/HrcQ family protein